MAKYIDFERISLTVELSSVQAINLFWVLQKSVQNTIKHASATQVLIKCWQENNRIYFVVNEKSDSRNSRNVEVKSEILKGTKIEFSFPLA